MITKCDVCGKHIREVGRLRTWGPNHGRICGKCRLRRKLERLYKARNLGR